LVATKHVILDRSTIVTRTPRYQSNFAWFQSNKFKFRDKAIFVGLPKEHEYFEWTFDIKIPYHPVKDALEMANVISGCKAFVSNATSTLAIAIGLGTTPIVQEVDPRVPSAVFTNKKNMNYI
jgi:ADP-heptose:LPS heptosyltransferase